MSEVFTLFPIFFIVSAGLFGALVGSFLNVVIYRLPVMMKHEWQLECYEFLNEYESDSDFKPPQSKSKFNLVVPRSKCPQCNHLIGAIENIPIISFIFLLGKCRHCSTKISIRYPFIELLTALLTATAAYYYGFSWHFLLIAVLTWGLIALSFIDFDHQLLPDTLVFLLLWIGLLYSPYNPSANVTPESSIIGAVAGYLILWTVTYVFKLITGKTGMGHGDFKLLAVFGAWLGWMLLPLIIVLSSFVGAIIGIGLIVFCGRDKNIPIPFGPYLAIAGLIAVYWGVDMVHAYVSYAGL